MRIRKKKLARPELEACKFYTDFPEDNIGHWHKQFKKDQPLYLELGCGKGSFISQLAVKNLNINYLAVDLVDAMLGLAKRNVEKSYNEKNIPIDNVILTRHDIERIDMFLNEKDVIDRIYINFCNPWPKAKHKKKRLTHTKQLNKYKIFLKQGGQIFFKTDDDELFKDSLEYFKESGFKIDKITYDLHIEPIFEDNIITEHEKMFSDEGIKIKALIATLENK